MAVGRTQMELKSLVTPEYVYMIRGVDAIEIMPQHIEQQEFHSVMGMPAGAGDPDAHPGDREGNDARDVPAQQRGKLPPRPVPDHHATL